MTSGRADISRPPDSAIANVGTLHHQIAGHFALHADAPLILPRGPSGVRIVKLRAGAREHAADRIEARAEVRPCDLGGRQRRAVNGYALTQTSSAATREADAGANLLLAAALPLARAENLRHTRARICDAEAAAENGLGQHLIGEAEARSKGPRIVMREIAIDRWPDT